MKSLTIVLHVTCAVFLQTVEMSKKSSQQNSCSASKATLAGIPGIPGAPGRDGRDGRDGIQGKPGTQGPPGQQGTPGSPGSVGKPGARGPKGDQGPEGPSSHSNWKECAWNKINDGTDNGLIKECVFYKRRTDTVLFVYWNGDYRVAHCTKCCKRWFFTFNGAECSVPAAIDGIEHPYASFKGRNVHHVKTIQGHCNNKIRKGNVRVGFHVGNCVGYGNADAFTGWNSVSRIYVEEVPGPQP